MTELTVLGGGIGGLTAALTLSHHGLAAHVLERAPDLSEIGAGLQISPNGRVVFDALGLGPSLDKAGIRARGVRLIDGPTGRDVAWVPLRQKPYLLLHRADLIDILAAAVGKAGIPLHLGAEVTQIETGTHVQLTFADGRTERATRLIGADGLHSVARNAVCPGLTPRFTGQVAWRAILPSIRQEPPEVQVHLGSGRHLVRYPLRGGACVNIVAVEEREDWAAEGWHHLDDPANLARAFSGFAPAIRDELDRIDRPYLWGLHRHAVAPHWHNGAVILLGDAAHPTLPFLAQGANMAIEDAWVLASCLSDGTGPAHYQRLRKSRTTRIIDAAQANATHYHLHPGPKRRAAHAALHLASALAPQLLTARYGWLYNHDVTKPPSSIS
ncbi:MAG: FAD-dependent monooxygenase [Pseudomonadota bacterium]